MMLKKYTFPNFLLIILAFSFFYSCEYNKNSIKSDDHQFDQLLHTALDFYANRSFDSATVYFYKAKSVCPPTKLDHLSYTLYYLAEIQQMQSDFSESEATATEAIKINPNYNQIYSFYNLLGLNYQEQNNFKEAIKYYNLSYKLAPTEIGKNVIKNNIGYVYLESNQFQKAKLVLEAIVKNDSLITDKMNYSKVLDNLGFTYFKLNNPKALDYLNQSLKIRDSLKDDSESIASYIHLSEFYQKTNPLLSRDFAQKAYNAATFVNSPDDKIEALKFLINTSDTNEIRTLSLRQMAIYDSINKVRQNSKNQFSKIKYDFSIAKKDSEKQKTQKQLYLSLLLFITTLSLVSYFAFRSRNRRKLLEATYKTETRISKKLHDELANDVHNAIAFAETQNLENPIHKETLLENLDTIYTRTRNISSENKYIDTGESFLDNLKDMITSYNSLERNIIINYDTLNWSKINKETKIVIYRIVQELLVNMKKHSQCSLASLVMKLDEKTIKINYSDNGVGSENKLKIKNGLQNVENRIESIKGTVTFETEIGKGFKSKIVIPI